MKNRSSRRSEAEVPAPRPRSTPPAALILPAYSNSDGSPSAYLEDTTVSGFPTGVVVPDGGNTAATTLDVSGCATGVDNRGRLEITDAVAVDSRSRQEARPKREIRSLPHWIETNLRSSAERRIQAELPPHVTFEKVRIGAFGTGIAIGEGLRVRGKGLVIDGCEVGIDNSGEFDGPDTIIR